MMAQNYLHWLVAQCACLRADIWAKRLKTGHFRGGGGHKALIAEEKK